MASFETLPNELQVMIWKHSIRYDRPVITSEPMLRRPGLTTPHSCVTSPHTYAFCSLHLRLRYREFLEAFLAKSAKVIRVNVCDFDFSNFIKYYEDTNTPAFKVLEQNTEKVLGFGPAALSRFHCTVDRPRQPEDLDFDGPSFAVSLIFTHALEVSNTGSQEGLKAWTARADALAQASGHLRMLYRVGKVECTADLDPMLSRMTVDDENKDPGQLWFIKVALRRKFTYERFAPGQVYPFPDINTCSIVEDYEEVWEDERGHGSGNEVQAAGADNGNRQQAIADYMQRQYDGYVAAINMH